MTSGVLPPNNLPRISLNGGDLEKEKDLVQRLIQLTPARLEFLETLAKTIRSAAICVYITELV